MSHDSSCFARLMVPDSFGIGSFDFSCISFLLDFRSSGFNSSNSISCSIKSAMISLMCIKSSDNANISNPKFDARYERTSIDRIFSSSDVFSNTIIELASSTSGSNFAINAVHPRYVLIKEILTANCSFAGVSDSFIVILSNSLVPLLYMFFISVKEDIIIPPFRHNREYIIYNILICCQY